MRKIFVSLAVLAAMSVQAEDLLVNGKSWLCECDFHLLNTDFVWDVTKQRYTIEVVGDTLVNDKPCKLLVKNIEGRSSKIVGYEEGGVVYRVIGNSSDFLPFIDFSARQGDELQSYKYYDENFDEEPLVPAGRITVVREETINGRRALTLSNGAQWVEGVGSSRGEGFWLTEISWCMPAGAGACFISNERMLECRQNGELIWSASDFTGIKTIQAETASGKVYDLRGRRVENPEPGRIYITNSSKVLW